MSNLVEIIAEALGRHRIERSIRVGGGKRDEWWNCVECDWESGISEIGSVNYEEAQRQHHAVAILAALKAQDIAFVELPRGEVNPDAWANQNGGVTLRHHVDLGSNFTTQRARQVAAELLAAADAAEAVSGA